MEQDLESPEPLGVQKKNSPLTGQIKSWLSNPRVNLGLRVAISAAILLALINLIDIQITLAIVASLDPLYFLSAILLSLLGRLIAAYRWYVLLHGKNEAVTLGTIVRLSFVSMFLGMFLPGAVGIEAIRVYGLSKETSDVHLSLTSVLLERLTGLFVLLLFVLLALNWAPIGMPAFIQYLAWLGLVGLVSGSIVIMNQGLRSRLDAVLTRLSLSFARRHFDKVYDCLDLYRDQKGLIVWSLVTAIIANVVRISMVWLCSLALGLDVSLFYFIIFVPIIVLIGMFPISVGGLGVVEFTFVFCFGLIGLPAESAFALGLLFLALNLVSMLPGAWIYLRRGIHA